MKRFFWIVLFLLIPSFALGQSLVTGSNRHFVPGNKVLFSENFSKCPVGELPEKFDRVKGDGECVRYGKIIWFSAISGGAGLLKEVPVGKDEFSIEFDVLFLKGACQGITLSMFEGKKIGEKRLSAYNFNIGPGCAGDAVYMDVEKVGRIYKSRYKSLKRRMHVAIQVRRKQYRVFLDGKRLTMMPFNGNVSSVGFFVRGKYGQLISNIRIAKYSSSEKKPSPEKLGIEVEKTSKGTKLTIPEKVLFDFNKFFLKLKAKKALDLVAEMLKRNPNKKIVIIGYTDNVGSDSYNLRLSLQRAQSVADYLIYAEDVKESRIKIEGKGKANPVAGNDTKEGRAKNRRVEIIY